MHHLCLDAVSQAAEATQLDVRLLVSRHVFESFLATFNDVIRDLVLLGHDCSRHRVMASWDHFHEDGLPGLTFEKR